NSGEFSWTPNSEQQGSYSVEFTVKDGSGESSRISISIEVQDVPDQPAPPGEGEGGN
ncbi:MAG: putative Ig domain-containing protein, partial [Calditrichaeota bacterium]|nr:putative Ig domain-containing protein [Calditrichota bacterium]